MTNPNFFPEPLRRIVASWDYWEQVAGEARRARAEAIAQTGRPVPPPTMPIGPRMSPTGEFGLFTPQIVFILAQTPNGYRIDVQDRGARSPWAEISDFYDLEKFFVWRIGDMVRREYGLRPLSAVFYEVGWQGGVRAEAVDPENSRLVRLFLEDDPQPRAMLGLAAAIPFSHVLQLDLAELEQHLRTRIPPQALPEGAARA
ncbi:hypothetical protein [Segniliparus rugosus]|uniref:Uncharacterized protein n=1 Tax=Segniliparus rugosus (strain ATCC BAA-974 / DSM 45345 / CCUG 50838 / CIP 108380 / JCM 13579 / CDC 945) TaxID=679197 RepID=E5XKP4_SEGRC|nr:hypothetical protein [Segniliparus rugosus]EFV15091.1 hypothetical protein HMPREF9336_00063 [Segniliparus rugosus ATCC BAA-974]